MQLLTCSALLGIASTLNAQAPTLAPGDTIPPSLAAYLDGVRRSSGASGALRSKLTILHFWSVTCKASIDETMRMDSIRCQFNGAIDVVAITKNKADVAQAQIQQFVAGGLQLPLLLGDTVLTKAFPYRTVPHHVWIDAAGIVRYVTSSSSTTSANLEKALSGVQLSLPYKREYADFDIRPSLLREGSGRLLDHLQIYSVLMDRVPFGGSSHSLRRDTLSGTQLLKIVNFRLISLYRIAYSGDMDGGMFRTDNRVIVESAHKQHGKQQVAAAMEEDLESVYSYEQRSPLHRDAFAIMRADLNRYFPYTGEIRRMKRSCWILRRNTNGPKSPPVYAAGFTEGTVSAKGVTGRYIVSLLPDLCAGLQEPLFDDTGNTLFDVVLRPAATIAQLQQQLHQYGLQLVQEERTLPMLVIRKP